MLDVGDRLTSYEPLWENWYKDSYIGGGNYGRVYRLRSEFHGQSMYSAVKVISVLLENELNSYGTNPRMLIESKKEKVALEIDNMLKLKGKSNLVQCLNYSIKDIFDGYHNVIGFDILIQMEYYTSLTHYLNKNGELSVYEIERLAENIAAGLRSMHQINMLHRDIKTDNIYIDRNNVYYLGDFGISKQELVSTYSTLAGTQSFIAPEVFRVQSTKAHYTKTADIYSYGITLYYLLNGNMLPLVRPGFRQNDIEKAIMDRLNGAPFDPPKNGSQRLKNVVMKCCAYQPQDRFQSVDELLVALSGKPFQQSSSPNKPNPVQQKPSPNKPNPVQQKPIPNKPNPVQQKPIPNNPNPVQQKPSPNKPNPVQQKPIPNKPNPVQQKPIPNKPNPVQQKPNPYQPNPVHNSADIYATVYADKTMYGNLGGSPYSQQQNIPLNTNNGPINNYPANPPPPYIATSGGYSPPAAYARKKKSYAPIIAVLLILVAVLVGALIFILGKKSGSSDSSTPSAETTTEIIEAKTSAETEKITTTAASLPEKITERTTEQRIEITTNETITTKPKTTTTTTRKTTKKTTTLPPDARENDYTVFDTVLVVRADEVDKLPLRSLPTKDGSEILARIPDGTTVHVLGFRDVGSEVWFRVDYDNTKGWCRGGMLQPNNLDMLSEKEYNVAGLEKWKSKFRLQTPSSTSYYGSADFKGTLYFIPDLSSGVQKRFRSPVSVDVMSKQGEWYYVEFYDDGYRKGWVHQSHLSF